MASLPAGVQREFELAVQRTGMTIQLRRALYVLTSLMKADPTRVERLFKIVLDRYEPNL